jgi:hypothetical protein
VIFGIRPEQITDPVASRPVKGFAYQHAVPMDFVFDISKAVFFAPQTEKRLA